MIRWLFGGCWFNWHDPMFDRDLKGKPIWTCTQCLHSWPRVEYRSAKKPIKKKRARVLKMIREA